MKPFSPGLAKDFMKKWVSRFLPKFDLSNPILVIRASHLMSGATMGSRDPLPVIARNK